MKILARTIVTTTAVLLFGLSFVYAGQVTIPNKFTAGEKAVASQVNGNFNAVETAINDNDSRIAALEAAVAAMQTRITDLETENAALRADMDDAQVDVNDLFNLNLDSRLTAVETNTVLDLDGRLTTGTDSSGYPAAYLTGINLHIRNGNAATATTNGTGNLIIGYNEARGGGQDARTGSHNLVIGRQHNYTSYGGHVVGYYNTISGAYSNVSGGNFNQATGSYSSVSGGRSNTASSSNSSVSGGAYNIARNASSSVVGGSRCVASGQYSTVGGGSFVHASAYYSTAMGGLRNNALENYASVFGGVSNGCIDYSDDGVDDCAGSTTGARGNYSAIFGGSSNTASGSYSVVLGGNSGTASGSGSVVIGGNGITETLSNNLATPHHP